MRAMSPRHTLFLFWTENSPFKTLAPLSEAFPPLPCFLGPLQDASHFLVIMRRAVLPFATMSILRSDLCQDFGHASSRNQATMGS